jgi:hypothetical protein
MMSVLDKLNLDEDMIVSNNALVYVRPGPRRTFRYQNGTAGVPFGTIGMFQ